MHSKQSQPYVNVAVVGLGFMGLTHLRAYLRNRTAKIVAVCDRSRAPVNGVLRGVAGNIQQAGDIHLGQKVKVYRDLAAVLADAEVELVDLCTPTSAHPAQTIAALKAGKHVVCEKPLARTSKLARAIWHQAERSRGMLMPAMCMRFWPGWSWLREVVEQRKYGRVLAAHFRRLSALPAWSGSGTYNDPGGALFDLHIHDTDFVCFLFGRPQGVFSTGAVNPQGMITHVTTQYSFADGPAVSAEGSWLLAAGFNMVFTLLCEQATLDFDLSRGSGALRIIQSGKTRVERLQSSDGYVGELNYFLECVRSGRPPSTVTAHDAVEVLEICEAEEKSLRTGRFIKL